MNPQKKRQDSSEESLLPFPDKDISPALQQTLQDKLDRGENDAIDRAEWDKIMQRVVPGGEEQRAEE